MERLTTFLLARRRLVLAAWVLLIVLGGVFAAGLPGRIVPGGDAPASSQSEAVARALANSPVPSLFVTIRVGDGDRHAGRSALTALGVRCSCEVITGRMSRRCGQKRTYQGHFCHLCADVGRRSAQAFEGR